MALARSLLSGLVLAATVVAHPTDQHAHKRAHEQAERDVTVYEESVATPTVVPDERIVFVNDNDQPTSTGIEDVLVLPATMSGDGTTTTMTATSTSTQTVVLAPASPTAAPGGTPPAGAPSPGATPGDALNNTTGDGPGPGNASLPGISYSPYRADQSCKSGSDIENDFSRFIGDYSMVRLYGTDCDQVSRVYRAAQKSGAKLFLGIYDLDKVDDEADAIAQGVKGDWAAVDTVSVGNELVNSGQASPSQVTSAVAQARRALRSAGYEGPVVTVDTFNAAEAHPELCAASDYCAVNAHPFFDSTVSAPGAGRWLADTAQRLAEPLPEGKRVVVTETGWPTEGAANGAAVPGMENQRAALASIREEFEGHPADVILLSAFNELWKQRSMATFNADQYWGIDGAVSQCDQ